MLDATYVRRSIKHYVTKDNQIASEVVMSELLPGVSTKNKLIGEIRIMGRAKGAKTLDTVLEKKQKSRIVWLVGVARQSWNAVWI